MVMTKVSSSLSIIGSSYIIYNCVKILSRGTQAQTQRKHRLSAEYNRILIALSFCDLISSFAFFVSPSALPFDESKERSFFNAGSKLTCDIQGAMFHFGLTGALNYNTCLAVYFYLYVRAKIQGKDIADLFQSKPKASARTEADDENDHNKKSSDRTFFKKEIMLHLCILFYPVLTTAILLAEGNMNPAEHLCWIKEFPIDCVGDECIRGQNTILFRLLFSQIPLAVCIAIIIISIVYLNRAMKKLSEVPLDENLQTSEKKISINQIPSLEDNDQNLRYNSFVNGEILDKTDIEDSEDSLFQQQQEDIMKEEISPKTENIPKNMNSSVSRVCKKVRRLSILYLLGLLSVWMPFLIQSLIFRFVVDFPKVYLFQILGPLQGFFNAMIFGNFNALVFIFRHRLVIVAVISVSVVIFFFFCDSETCVYGEMAV